MSEHPRELHFVVDIDGRLSRKFGGNDQRSARHHDSELNDQFLAALDATVDDAARHEGLSHLTALEHRSEGHRCNHTNSNHAKTTASTIPAAIASIRASLSDIGNSFGFALAMTRWHRLKLSWRRLRQSWRGK